MLVLLGISIVLYGMANPLPNISIPQMPQIPNVTLPAQLKGMAKYKALIIYGIVAFFTILGTEYLIVKFRPDVNVPATAPDSNSNSSYHLPTASMGTFGQELLASPTRT